MFLDGLPRRWVTIYVPGSHGDRQSTYVGYPAEAVPSPPRSLATWQWLEDTPSHADSFMASAFESAERDLSVPAAEHLMHGTGLPDDFRLFVERGLRERLRSATDCYFDLGHASVRVDGGRLLHFLSDSQWVCHWLLFVGDRGEEAVVATAHPTGFLLDAEEDAFWQRESWGYVVVAESFVEFVWRWHMDNEIFYSSVVDNQRLTHDQVHYLEALGHAGAAF